MSPDVQWLLVVLGTLDPNHIFFESTYRPELPQREANLQVPTLKSLQGFFEVLPPSKVLSQMNQSKKGKLFMKRVFKKQQSRTRREQELDSVEMMQYQTTSQLANRNPQSLVRPVQSQRTIVNSFGFEEVVEADMRQTFNDSFPQQARTGYEESKQNQNSFGDPFNSFSNFRSASKIMNQLPSRGFIDEASNEVSLGAVTESRSLTTHLNQFGLSPEKSNRREEQSVGHQQKKKLIKKDQTTPRVINE